MNLDDQRLKMECSINKLIHQFQEDTGLTVTDLTLKEGYSKSQSFVTTEIALVPDRQQNGDLR